MQLGLDAQHCVTVQQQSRKKLALVFSEYHTAGQSRSCFVTVSQQLLNYGATDMDCCIVAEQLYRDIADKLLLNDFEPLYIYWFVLGLRISHTESSSRCCSQIIMKLYVLDLGTGHQRTPCPHEPRDTYTTPR